ncbi:MAG: ethyl tert-butyl ether degradation protein EthD [SAR202 cluster bacterium Io17-Chloro-G9]|nr:MAG: ethyl tert-butyl ether degradation protein EthD [SAR202 cluster bacterium Io17-Chloro-G9]
MIRVTVQYPNEPGKKFDFDYFVGDHMAIVHRELDHRGLVRVEIDKGISAADPSAPAPLIGAAHLIFNTIDEVHAAFMAAGRPVMGDIPNYTDIAPTIQISEMVG